MRISGGEDSRPGMRTKTVANHYIYHRILTAPREWQAVARRLEATSGDALRAGGGSLYGVWRSQIGLPRDELTAISCWPDAKTGLADCTALFETLDDVVTHSSTPMTPTLRPLENTPPSRQGNYAFRQFTTPHEHWDEFLELCVGAWPGFESSYDSQIIGLWRFDTGDDESVRSLLLTRRPDLAMWERSKIPADAAEAEVRRKLSRRYDLCTSTAVYTTTLITAKDAEDTARWT